TTLYAQDFKDEEGDRLPIFPGATRFSMMFSIPLWSFGLSRICKIDSLSTTAFAIYVVFEGT
ncbi:hypothetical protein DEU56DRAFT_733051, partial [Suillus clintonianus]|uniref:uncharacterized protein n=1 Tax=Suillus clintonianus TaxID=1904413 RepID=UPI001B85E9A6